MPGGVSDEDLFGRALADFDKLHADDKPFFAVVLTVSNHRPYTFPEGRIDGPKGSRVQAVKYADWALGDFFKRARSHAFYDQTPFLVMGDHGARVYGSQMFPIKSYRVPVLFITPQIERAGTSFHTLASSIDIAPTIMGCLGGKYRSVFMGRDALHVPRDSGYALLQHNHDLALLESRDRMAILGPKTTSSQFRLDKSTWNLLPTTRVNGDLLRDTIGFFQSGDDLYYSRRWYPGDD